MDLPPQLLQQGIARGSILLSDSFEDIDHSKFFAVIGVYQNLIAGFFFINSNINSFIQNKPALFAMQYPLKKSEYPFLRYDSFLSASQLQTRPIDKLVESMTLGRTNIVGELTADDLDRILESCRQSNLFSPIEKLRFFY